MTGGSDEKFLGEDKEWLIQYCRSVLQEKEYHYFIFGHRHLPIAFQLTDKSQYLNLGDWLRYNSYAVYDGVTLSLKHEA